MNVFAYTAKIYLIKFIEGRKGDRRTSKSQYNIDFGFTSLSRSTAATAELAATRMRSTMKTSRDILGNFAIICDRHVTCRIAVPTKWDAARIGAFILVAFILVRISATNLASHPQLAASQFLSAVNEILPYSLELAARELTCAVSKDGR